MPSAAELRTLFLGLSAAAQEAVCEYLLATGRRTCRWHFIFIQKDVPCLMLRSLFLGWNFAVNESLDNLDSNLDNSDVIQTRVLRRKPLLPAAFSCPLVGFYDIFSGESKSLYLYGLHKL